MNLSSRLFGEDVAILHDRNFQMLMLANVLGPMAMGVVSPILDSLIGPFGTSPENIGLMISAYTAPAIVAIPISGHLSDHYGRKPLLVGSLLLFGAAGTAIAFTTNFGIVLVLRTLQGVAYGGLVPNIITSLGDIYDGTVEATAQGVRLTGSGFIQTIFPLLAGTAVVFAWQYPFLLYAIAFPIAAVVVLWFEEPTNRNQDGSTHQKRSNSGSKVRPLLLLLRTPRALSLIAVPGFPMMVWVGFLTYNSIIVVRIAGGTPAEAGLLVALGSFAYATGATQSGRVTAMFESRYYPLVAANFCLAIGFAFFLFASMLSVAAVSIVISGVGFGLAISLSRSVITGLTSESLRGSIVSIAESFNRLAATLTPLAMGAVIGIAEPIVGLQAAVQIAGLAIGAVSAGGSVLCLVSARLSPPIPEPVSNS